ncbi:MAG: nucleotidyltransferase [Candidatus Rokubacteria bacterium]|nr:nucleotidyltransferase [Candidatus Rokubacteria bacterium]
MTPDEYLQGILDREAVNTGPLSPVRGVQAVIAPIIREWAGAMLLSVQPSGSFMKGTANKSGTDIDLFISISEQTPDTLKQIYGKLFNRMTERGYKPTRQNVSINIRVNGYSVDLVPGKRQDTYSADHSLYRRKADTWTKTNVLTHIKHVTDGGRQKESRIIKLWRAKNNLDFPSFYLELTVINALALQHGTLSGNVLRVFQYLSDAFQNARIVDPANTNNIISDDLAVAEKTKIKAAAAQALKAANWSQIVI